MRRIETVADIAEGLATLVEIEPQFARLVAMSGEIPLRRADPGFAGLCRIIISQQVSVASARAIWDRVSARFPQLAAPDILAASEAELRSCGLSGPKIRTLRAIATTTNHGHLDFARLDSAAPEDVRAMMTAVSGIGPWTADIYLMFHLGHADVFAPGDLALQEAARLGFGLATRPGAREMACLAEVWSPWRAVAARLLWAYYAAVKSREGMTI